MDVLFHIVLSAALVAGIITPLKRAAVGVLVDRHAPDLEKGNDWSILCTGAYSLAPSVPEDRRRFTKNDWVAGHKITMTTRPEMHGISTSAFRP
jgi:hypothetical protein